MAKKKKDITVHPVAYRIIVPTLKRWFEKSFNLKAEIPEDIMNLNPPYLLLANHQGFWDPFMAGIYLKHPVFYITSDAIFRSAFFKFILSFLGAIPKTKAQSDIDALKNIIAIKGRGNIIGIFPEGRRTWDGVTLPLVYSTSKLIRMLKVPVITVLFKGGFFSQPRWGFNIQKGEVLMEYKKLFSGEEVASMKVADIHRKLADSLHHDEIEYQKVRRIEYRGVKTAEFIEQFLFACPSCSTIGKLRSGGRKFYCDHCGEGWEINTYQEITGIKGETIYNNTRDWNRWQLKLLESMLDEAKNNGSILMEDKGLLFHTGFKSRRLKLLAKGSMTLTVEKIDMYDTGGQLILSAPLPGLSGLNIQNREVLDFYYEGKLYTVRGIKKRFSAYKWLKALEHIQQERMKRFEAE
jgi:1-acyl-sn-glycerol-3-phosphate acyltransferase